MSFRNLSGRALAQIYLGVNWIPVPIPLRSKAPIGEGWADRSVADGLAGFLDGPQNVGVLLGAPSGIVDIDLDCEEARTLAPLFLPPTRTFGRQSSPRSHWLYRYAGKTRQFSFSVTKGSPPGMLVELRSDGAQTVFPGSTHESGEEIEFADSNPVATCADLELRVRYLATACLLARYWPGEGARHKARLALAGGLVSSALDIEWALTIAGAIAEWGGERDQDWRTSVESTYLAAERGDPITGWGALSEYVPASVVGKVQAWLGGGVERPFLRGDHVELGGRLLEALGPIVGAEGCVWRYDMATGLYSQVPSDEQARIVQRFAGARMRNEKKPPLSINISDVHGAMAAAAFEVGASDFFREAPAGVAFSNGFMAVEGNRLVWRNHAPENRARGGYPFAYEHGPHPHAWFGFLAATFHKDVDEVERIQLLQEYLGACIFGLATRFQKVLVFVSEQGATGKSTTIKVLSGAMPDKTVTNIPPQLWGSEYRRALLAGARLNAVNELPSQDISETEAFKAIVAGDEIDARRIREEPFTLHPIAGHVFACNALPATPDVSNALFRRVIVLRFANEVDPSKIRAGVAARLLAERPAIVSWAVQGLQRLLEREAFVVPTSSDEQVRLWRSHADSVSSWVTEACEVREWANAAMLYQHYVSWCAMGGFKAANRNTWGTRLVALGVRKRSVSGGNQYLLTIRQATKDNVIPGPWGGR